MGGQCPRERRLRGRGGTHCAVMQSSPVARRLRVIGSFIARHVFFICDQTVVADTRLD